ncbi:MAG: T9SS type A sorting domain-containing protein [Muribaculaceae bacterium]|nr:T9SS type A sorting domain-containing protein [Muribaculaceae bacterium]
MRQHLLIAGLIPVAFGMNALSLSPSKISVAKTGEVSKVQKVKKSGAQGTVKRIAPGVNLLQANGLKRLETPALQHHGKIRLNPRKAASRASELPEGYVLFESFEDWDGDDYYWTPDGWTVEMKGDVDKSESWTPNGALPGLPAPADGDYFFGINYSDGQQDEWLESPYVTVAEGMQLSYWVYVDPVFLYSLDNVDWDTMEFIGDKEVAATLQVYVQEEGGEWVMVRDYAEEYNNYDLAELMLMSPYDLEKHTISLDGYYDKKVRVAFRYVGTDGNTMFIDAIGIGYPSIEGLSYMSPFNTLYWGWEDTWELSGLGAGIAIYPVFAPLTWTNMTYDDEVEYTWKYCHPITGDWVTDNDPDELTVTYVPDYSSEALMRNNFFYPPILEGTAEFCTPGSYQAPYTFLQAGGKAEYKFQDGSSFDGSLLFFNWLDRGIGATTVTDDEIGAMNIPVFGHDANTDRYWTNYTLNGEDPVGDEYSHLVGIANLFYPSTEAPLVVNGINVYGLGQIADDAELTATIYGVNEEMSTDISTMEVMGRATITGKDISKEEENSKGYICMPFKFEEPVVVQGTEEHPVYFIMLEGFNSEKVEYFLPFQAKTDDPHYMCLGYILNHIDMETQTGRAPYYSLKPMVYKEDDEYIDLYSAFAIAMDAEYPWLTCDTEKVTLPADGAAVSVNLGSYYDGSKLTVEAPEGVVATVKGRYNKCKLTLSFAEDAEEVNGNVVVKGPGVEVTVAVDGKRSGIASVTADAANVKAIYDLSGRIVKDTKEAGVYVVKFNDGTTRKLVVK